MAFVKELPRGVDNKGYYDASSSIGAGSGYGNIAGLSCSTSAYTASTSASAIGVSRLLGSGIQEHTTKGWYFGSYRCLYRGWPQIRMVL